MASAAVLLRHGAELGQNALMIAVAHARWDLAQLYLEHGCDPAFRNRDGQSALDIAKQQPPGSERDAFIAAWNAAIVGHDLV